MVAANSKRRRVICHTIHRISTLLRVRSQQRTRTDRTKMEQNPPRFERIRKSCGPHRSRLALLKRGFGEYYQCGYWAALENRGSRLLAAARGSNPLLSAALRDPRDFRTCLTREWFLTNLSSNGILKLVLKRGPIPVFQGGLTGRLSLLPDIPLGIADYA